MRGLAAVLLIGTMPAASALNPGVALGIDLGTSGVRVNIVEKKTNGSNGKKAVKKTTRKKAVANTKKINI